MKHFRLKSGVNLPAIGIGTDGLSAQEVQRIIADIPDMGYRLIDTATAYKNHRSIAQALANVDRKQVFICTKFNNADLQSSTVEAVCNKILSELNTDYIDLLLIHSPTVANFPLVLKELIKLKETGKINSIGVSNFTSKHLEMIKEDLDHVDVNQIEFHPLLNQSELKKYCQQHNVHIMAYRPFGLGIVLADKTLAKIAANHHKSVAQVILNWLNQQGFSTIPKTGNPAHQIENFAALDFELTPDEISQINSLNKNLRTCTGPWADFDSGFSPTIKIKKQDGQHHS